MKEIPALADELMQAMDDYARRFHDTQFLSMRGEMAVMRMLGTLARSGQPQVAAGELSRGLAMTTPRVAAVLNALEKKGMVVRCADAQDRRRVMVSLTEAGATFLQARHAQMRGHVMRMLDAMGETDSEQFVRLSVQAMGILASPAFASCIQEEPSPRGAIKED